MRIFITLALVFVSLPPVFAMDYVRLRSGETIEGAVLRQDSSVVIVTDWDQRHERQPQLQVYTRQEVESIWFVKPSESGVRHIQYSPHESLFELGGNFLFQSWAETKMVRRQVIQLSVNAGYSIMPALGLELSGDFTVPLGGANDTVWHSYDGAYHVVMNVVAHPFRWKGLVPFAVAGGGAAIGVPVNGVTFISSTDVRSLADIGLGVKWGVDHLGMRAEVRHHFYTWTPDAVDEFGIRADEQTADATMVRIGLFYFR